MTFWIHDVPGNVTSQEMQLPIKCYFLGLGDLLGCATSTSQKIRLQGKCDFLQAEAHLEMSF